MNNAKKILKIIMPIVAAICTIIFTPWVLLRIWISPLPDTIQEQVNDAIHQGLAGIIVYIDQSGKPPAFYAAGWNNKENQVPADPQALFKIASISKLYVAAATAKLVSNQSLSLEDTLADLLPELNGRIEYADQITLRMLLQHRSGIPDWIEDKEFPWGNPPTDVGKVLELVLDDPAEFKPGRRYDYSNTNYLLIGNILDQTLGYSHRQYITEEMLAPLGLSHTFGLFSDADPGKVMSGYDTHYEGDVKMLDFVSPSGSMVASAEDVGIFLRALNDGSLLNEDEQKIYSTVYTYEHTGLLPGYQSIARYYRDIDTVVIQFANTSGGKNWGISEMIYHRIVKILKRQTAHPTENTK